MLKILDIKIDIISKQEVLEKIKNLFLSSKKKQYQLITTNPEFILAAQKDQEFKQIINSSWLSVADGYGIRLASKYLQRISNFSPFGKQLPISKNKLFHYFIVSLLKLLYGLKVTWWGITKNDKKLDVIKEVITGTDLVIDVGKILETKRQKDKKTKRQDKIFLLGGYGEVPRLASEKLKERFLNLQFSYSVFETKDIIEKINQFQPGVLFVALNHPQAQKWIDQNLSKMPSVKLAIGVGGAFDYISGKIKRASRGMQGAFEWLYRLVKQPGRCKRIYTAVVKFPWLVFKYSL